MYCAGGRLWAGCIAFRGFFVSRDVLRKNKYWWQRLSNPAADSNWGFFGVLFEFPAESSLLLRPLIGEARSRMFADDLPYLGQRHYVLLKIVFF